jgi:ABC-type transport system substrate-binding protein
MSARPWLAALLLAAGACTNNPYPEADDESAVRYRYLSAAPKTLDPAVSYAQISHLVLVNVYETLLEYQYLKRPYALMPGLAREVPRPRRLPDGRSAYRFRLREGMLYADDPAFAAFAASGPGGPARSEPQASEAHGEPGASTREIVAADVAFELMRLADPAIGSPIFATMARIDGFREFSERLAELREREPGFAELRIDRQYERAGGIRGVRTPERHTLEIELASPYPQILYWFAMAFTAPVPWEAVVYYDGEQGRDLFRDHPVSVGPYRITRFDRWHRIVLERNENWYGVRHPEWRAPGAIYPETGEPEDVAAGRLDPAYAGRPLPFVDRIEFRIEKEDIPRFSKFLQGYYDDSTIVNESFDQLVHEGALSEDMAARGMRLDRAVDPDVYYIGFNLDDPVVGAPAGERGRWLRHAMSLGVDAREFTRLFLNGRGIPAQSPIPPGIFGYEQDYANPARAPDRERARELLRRAGYPNGIDPATGKPLRLTFDTADTSTAGRLRYQFFADSWAQLGLDVEVVATNYNRFLEKMREGSYQLFMSGWIADYPDPENFFFLLWGEMARSHSGGENNANFRHRRFDELFLEMKDLENGPRRLALIREMRRILERERPWIELIHRESYQLYHGWMRNVKAAGLTFPEEKYRDVDVAQRARLRREWNRPGMGPAWALAGIGLAVVVPGSVTFFRERQ